ncbi:hypothetical protein VTI28DRAFT_3400 [Corynascus sepedonium]
MQPLPGGKFPKEYRNKEGPPENPRENFDGREIQGRPGPVNPGDKQVFEYPVKALVQPPPFTSERRWEKPPNDPGPIRAVVNKDRKVVGAIYHPEGNTSGYERAGLQPLDAKGRAEVARHTDKKLTGRSTWPQRGPEWLFRDHRAHGHSSRARRPQQRRVLDVASYPTVSSRFDNRTALLNIKGVYDEGYYKDARTSKSYIDSPVTISFLGSINQDRSDELLSSSDDVRVWKWTLGYSETLFGQSAASPRNGLSTWLYIAGTIS